MAYDFQVYMERIVSREVIIDYSAFRQNTLEEEDPGIRPIPASGQHLPSKDTQTNRTG